MVGEREVIDLNGAHLMLDTFGCDKSALGNEKLIRKFLEELPSALGMRKISKPLLSAYSGGGTWDRGGVSAVVLIAESHISIHTFPHDGFFTADVYSCKPFDAELALSVFRKYFKGTKEKIKIVKRDIQLIRERNMATISK